MRIGVQPRPPQDEAACPVCKDVLAGARAWRCGACQAELHEDCRRDLAGCPTLGCQEAAPRAEVAPAPGKAPPRAQRPLLRTILAGALLLGALLVSGAWVSASRPPPARTPGPRPTRLERPDLSHVAPGQRWVFEHRDAEGALLERSEREVLEVTPLLIRTRVIRLSPHGDPGRGLQPGISPPRTDEWLIPGVTRSPGHLHSARCRHELVVQAGREWLCAVAPLGGLTCWTPLSDDSETFPGTIRLELADGSVVRLVEVLPPPPR